jgi:hypothetical protein
VNLPKTFRQYEIASKSIQANKQACKLAVLVS